MIVEKIANGLTDRALAAWHGRSADGASDGQPVSCEPRKVGGLWYIDVVQRKAVVGLYRIREVNGQPMLKALKRWPADI